ncbi:MAG: hypothetical protein R3202_06770, partial [Candidatus Competibacterales bacterium]|nr:hypothetical protein [Candidatus Competibacterales bacterium]
VEQKQVALEREQQKIYEARQIENLAQGEARRIRLLAEAEAEAVKVRARAAAEARLVRAEAEAEALNLVASALKNRDNLLAYRYIEKLSPNVRAVVLPDGLPLIFPLPDLDLPNHPRSPWGLARELLGPPPAGQDGADPRQAVTGPGGT